MSMKTSMKKRIRILTALTAVLALICTAAFAEEGGAGEEEGIALPAEGWVADGIDGAVWQDDRASLEVIPEEDCIKVLILWGSSAWEMTEWTYRCYYDEETQALKAVHLVCDDVAYDEEGNETRSNVMDQDCETVFSLNGEGQVTVLNAADERLEGKAFTLISMESDSEQESGV